jgi:hypothetical protein
MKEIRVDISALRSPFKENQGFFLEPHVLLSLSQPCLCYQNQKQVLL